MHSLQHKFKTEVLLSSWQIYQTNRNHYSVIRNKREKTRSTIFQSLLSRHRVYRVLFRANSFTGFAAHSPDGGTYTAHTRMAATREQRGNSWPWKINRGGPGGRIDRRVSGGQSVGKRGRIEEPPLSGKVRAAWVLADRRDRQWPIKRIKGH